MQCAKCGTTNRGGMKFCEECGARLLLPCPGCGEPTLAGKKFCGECGTPLITPSAAPQTPDARLFSTSDCGLRTNHLHSPAPCQPYPLWQDRPRRRTQNRHRPVR